MNSSSDPKVFQKILVRNVTFPLVLSAIISGVFIGLIMHMVSVNHWVDHSNNAIGRAHSSLKDMVDFETGLRGYLITGKESFLEPYHHAMNEFRPGLHDFINFVSDNPQQVERLKEIENKYQEWDAYAKDLIDRKTNNRDFKSIIVSETGKRQMDAIRQDFADFIHSEESLRDARVKTSEETIHNALILIVVLSLLIGVVLALFSRKQLLTLSQDYSSALAKQLEQNRILQYQEWLQTGQAKLAYEIRGEQTIDVLSDKILNFLAHYVDAAAGTLYIMDELGNLKRSASYAVSSSHDKENSIRVGQTLIGQAAAENRILKIKQVPDNYLQITSGLGETTPGALIIAPLVADKAVQAVIEFAFFGEIAPQVEELLSRVAEMTGLSVRSSQYRAKLQSLLIESQQQAEELQVQQEELKVNNEELEEQSRALKESQIRLENQQAEMEQVNSQLEEQTQALSNQNHELIQTRTSLEEKAHELEVSSQYKSQFLANMSHELRTPLNSTLILAQLLAENKNRNLNPEQIEFAKTILGSSNDLLNLINDILDLSKVEAGKIDLQPEKINLREMASFLNRTFLPLAEAKKIKFEVAIDPTSPEMIETDKQRLEQILKNLVSNAIKFTEKGIVKVEFKSKQGSKRVTFSVSDTGIGISKEQQGVIFEAFRQADGTTNRRFGGTGLGLTISRDLARLLGGAIEVNSVVGEGSNFSLVLPPVYSPLTSESSSGAENPVIRSVVPAPAPFDARGERVKKAIEKAVKTFEDDRDHLEKDVRVLLVVEDDQAFAKILYDLSHEMKFKCLVAITAEEGIDMAESFLPNAVILDMNLPDHNGLTVLDHLKGNPKTRHIPVHVVSAGDHSYAAFQMGAIGYQLKPVQRKELTQIISRLESKLAQEFKRVLVVEDNKAQRDAICKLIEDDVVKTTAVESGSEALVALDKSDFDCMIVDLTLPDMSGYDLLEKVNASDKSKHLPVIVYTGRDITRKEEEQLKKYSNSIILKGASSPERLLSEVTLFLHQVESRMPADRQRVLRDFRDREKIFESKKILLVDDDVRNIFALGSALEGKGATVIIARNGLEAVKEVKNNPQIDLVLMDIMMPEMDGYAATREIRKDPRFARLPIIAVTAKAMPDDQRRCLEAGANDYLSKPIDLQKLLSLIRVWMPTSGAF